MLAHMFSRIPPHALTLSPATMTCIVTTGSVTRFSNLIDALAAAPGKRPFVTAWIDEDEREAVTFAEFRRRARSQAKVLHDQGVTAGLSVCGGHGGANLAYGTLGRAVPACVVIVAVVDFSPSALAVTLISPASRVDCTNNYQQSRH